MIATNSISITKRIALLATVALFATWVLLHSEQFTSTQNGTVRLFFTLLVSIIIILRPKEDAPQPKTSPNINIHKKSALRKAENAIATAILGGFILIIGSIYTVPQFEWIGLLIICFAIFKWALPSKYREDIVIAIFLLYWVHPLPELIFTQLQLWTLKLSVSGSEWLLHLFNVPVWANKMVLLTEITTFEVHTWYSGLHTAITVALLAAGAGILRRIKWYHLLVFITAAIIQAIILNIVRISLIVVLTPKLSGLTSASGLYGTSSMVVIATLLLVHLELMIFHKYTQRKFKLQKETSHIHEKLITAHPPFWKKALTHHKRATFAISAIILLSAILYINSKNHRIEMVGKLTQALVSAGHYEDAEASVDYLLNYLPEDTEWNFTRISILLALQKYEEVLLALDTIPGTTPHRKAQKQIIKAYSLMGLEKIHEASTILTQLPEATRETDPRVAMILAEMAFHSDDPDKVAQHIITASTWLPNTARVRMLYPYLRANHKWKAISDSNLKTAHSEIESALSATEAYMNLNNASAVAVMTAQSIKSWPYDIRVLEPLFFLSLKHSQPKWENLFSEHLIRSVNNSNNPDLIYPILDKCFQLARPDMAWFIYNRIQQLAPNHPFLPFTIAKYGNRWFLFRKSRLDFPATSTSDTIDISTYISTGNCLLFFQPSLNNIPYAYELCNNPPTDIRKQQLTLALDRFKQYKEAGRLSMQAHYEYIDALEMAGAFEKIKTELTSIATSFPDQADQILLKSSELYEHNADWPNVYEALRKYRDTNRSSLTPLLRLCNAERELKLGMLAIQTARHAVELNPNSTKAAAMLAETLAEFSSAEEALHALNQPRKWLSRDLDILTANIMQQTQRFKKAQQLCEAAMYPTLPIKSKTIQYFFAKPAEFSILWHQTALPSEDDFKQNAKTIRTNLNTTDSPFLKAMLTNWLSYYDGNDTANANTFRKWRNTGRSNTEKATSLQQYMLLLCNNHKYKEALEVALLATKLMPQSPLLWQSAISLSDADVSVVTQARHACPNAPEIWLAELVARTRLNITNAPSTQDNAWQENDILTQLALITKKPTATYPAETMTRASEYLFRIGMYQAATVAAEDASDHAQSYLPAHVMAIKCAIKNKDKRWALRATNLALDSAINPPLLLFKELVRLKQANDGLSTDSETIEALSSLRRNDPNNVLWAEMLGFIRFQRGDWEVMDALEEMTFAIKHGSKKKMTYIIAAESARLIRDYDQAVTLLREGLTIYPNDKTLRNNLAYILVQTEDGVTEATEIIETLIKETSNNIQILDTATMIFIKNGQLQKAKAIIEDILTKTTQGSNIYFRAKTHEANIAMQENDYEKAQKILEQIVASADDIPKYDLIEASDLLNKARADMKQ